MASVGAAAPAWTPLGSWPGRGREDSPGQEAHDVQGCGRAKGLGPWERAFRPRL